MKNKFTIGAFAIIKDGQGKILLCHRIDRDMWNLPGGAVEKDESPWDAVVREVREETGLDVKVSRLVGVYSKSDMNDLSLDFDCKVLGGEIILNTEADQIEYFAVDDLPKNLILRHLIGINAFVENNLDVTLKVQLQRLVKDIDGTEKLYKK